MTSDKSSFVIKNNPLSFLPHVVGPTQPEETWISAVHPGVAQSAVSASGVELPFVLGQIVCVFSFFLFIWILFVDFLCFAGKRKRQDVFFFHYSFNFIEYVK